MKKMLALTFTAGLLLAPASQATLIGDEITFEFVGVDSATGIAGTDDLTVVGPFGDDFFIPTFTDDTITITYDTVFASGSIYAGFSALKFSGLDWGGLGTLETVGLVSTSVAGLLSGDVTLLGPESFEVALFSGEWFDGDTVILSVSASHSAVPEPASLALIGLGLAGIGFTRRKVRS